MSNTQPFMMMMVGVPYSGKSTFIANQFFSDDVVVLGIDKYIMRVSEQLGVPYDELINEHYQDAEKSMYRELNAAIQNNQSVVWDQTNLTKRVRAKKLAKIPNHYNKICVFFNPPSNEILKSRYETRTSHKVPLYVVEGMAGSFEIPSIEEGFNYVAEIA